MKAPNQTTPEYRCGNCNRLLARGLLEAGTIELQCPRCKTRLHLRASRPSQAPHDGLYEDRHDREKFSSLL